MTMPRDGYKSIAVRENTFKLFQKFRGMLFVEKGRKVTEDEAIRELLHRAAPELMASGERI